MDIAKQSPDCFLTFFVKLGAKIGNNCQLLLQIGVLVNKIWKEELSALSRPDA